MTKHPSSPHVGPDDDTVELEGVARDKRDRTDRPRVVPSSESAIGGIEHDDRGRARWKWKAEITKSSDPNAETFDHLKALEADLELARSQKVRVLVPSTKTGLNPYDTARPKKPK